VLFPYTYIEHDMEKMQGYIDFIFFELWCNAPSREYDISLFDPEPELKEIIIEFHSKETQWGDFFVSKIQEIYNAFSSLESARIAQLRQQYCANNDIKKLCANHNESIPLQYKELKKINRNLTILLKSFCENLYNNDFLSLKTLSSRIGNIEDHYNEFMKVNQTGKCPFCGLTDVEGSHSAKREAYDHYVPKSVYPFNSINFQNLAPMCHKCNSSYKTVNDPIFDKSTKQRRKAFYVYMGQDPEIKIEMEIEKTDIENLSPEDITLKISSDNFAEEVRTWMDVFGIEQRYKDKCTHKTDGSKYWYTQIMEEGLNVGISPEQMLALQKQAAEKNPLADTNFLKKPFLEACRKLGLFG
jgi:hypothetical protein